MRDEEIVAGSIVGTKKVHDENRVLPDAIMEVEDPQGEDEGGLEDEG